LARLHGARLVAATEPDRAKKLDEAAIKRVTGQDVITARFLYSEFFDFKFRGKIWLAANHKPHITGTDEGIWRRIRLIPFTVQITEAEKDPDLPDKLRKEYPGILRWMLEGANRWYADGLGMPEAVKAATATYRSEMDRLSDFLADCCVVGPEYTVKSKALFDLYRNWCSENGEKHPLTHKKLTMTFGERGISVGRNMKERFYVGIGILEPGSPSDVDDDFDGPYQKAFDD
jgi:putative DNA primase/helicase